MKKLLSLVALLVTSIVSTAFAAPGDGSSVPPALREWEAWVRERQPERSCALVAGVRQCEWPTALVLQIEKSAINFELSVRCDQPRLVRLPGSGEYLPNFVRDQSGNSLPIQHDGNGSSVYLPQGNHLLRGALQFSVRPQQLYIPPAVALVKVSVDGKEIARPRFSENGALWLVESEEGTARTQPARLELQVYRRIRDGVPFTVETTLRLRVSGPPREVQLGGILPPGMAVGSIESPLPVVVSATGELGVQLRPGEHLISLASFQPTPPKEIRPPQSKGDPWPEFEVWSWVPDESIRSVNWSGGSPTDPSRYEVPDEWASHAAFVVQPADTVTLAEARRGEELTAQNRLSLSRTLWLDNSGAAFTVEDSFTGSMNTGWQVTATPELELGRVTVNGTPALITGTTEARSIELREEGVNLVGLSRLVRSADLSAIGWLHEVDSLSIRLLLPPGWRFFDAEGPDSVSRGWWDSWSLLRVFFVLLITVGIAKVGSRTLAAVACASLIALHQVAGAPFMGWFHVLLAISLHRFLQGRAQLSQQIPLQNFVVLYARLTIALVILRVLVVVATELRAAIFPFVSARNEFLSLLGWISGLTEGDVFQWPLVVLLISIFLTFIRAIRAWEVWRAVKYFILLCVLGIFIPGVISTIQYEFVGDTMVANAPQAFESYSAESAYPSASAPALAGKMRRSQYGESGSADLMMQQRKSLQVIDPSAVVQSGPGRPAWNGSEVRLQWSGPVTPDQQLRLYLLSPSVVLLVTLLRVALLIAFALGVLRLVKGMGSALGSSGVAAALLLLVFSIPHVAIAQGFPSTELLSELEQRMDRAECKENCTSIGRADLRVDGEILRIELDVASNGEGALPLPGPVSSVLPRSVGMNGSPAAVRRGEEGHLWVRVPHGTHQIVMEVPLRELDELALSWMHPKPTALSTQLPGWELLGIRPSGIPGDAMTLQRVAKRGASAASVADERITVPYYLIEREVQFDVGWSVTTTVRKIGGIERGSSTSVQLLPGEVVSELGDGLSVRGETEVNLTFRRNEDTKQWQSTLPVSTSLALTASERNDRSEVWSLGCSNLWRCSWSGVTPIATRIDGQHRVIWKPYSGESTAITIAKPAAVPGQEVTIQDLSLQHRPGPRVSQTTITFTVQSFRGGVETVTIPAASTIRSVKVNGIDVTGRFSGQALPISFDPGVTAVVVEFTTEQGVEFITKAPPVSMTTAPSNVTISIEPPEARWILWLGGEPWGPRVVFWSSLLIVVGLAYGLSWTGRTILSVREWILLGLSATVFPVTALVLPILWQFTLRYRRDHEFQNRGTFNALQLLLAFLTISMIAWVYFVVQQGLLAEPDMGVLGNGSSTRSLRWFVDRSSAVLSEPYLISTPLWIWRGAMLLWSTWLVFGLLRWVRETLSILLQGGFWRSK